METRDGSGESGRIGRTRTARARRPLTSGPDQAWAHASGHVSDRARHRRTTPSAPRLAQRSYGFAETQAHLRRNQPLVNGLWAREIEGRLSLWTGSHRRRGHDADRPLGTYQTLIAATTRPFFDFNPDEHVRCGFPFLCHDASSWHIFFPHATGHAYDATTLPFVPGNVPLVWQRPSFLATQSQPSPPGTVVQVSLSAQAFFFMQVSAPAR